MHIIDINIISYYQICFCRIFKANTRKSNKSYCVLLRSVFVNSNRFMLINLLYIRISWLYTIRVCNMIKLYTNTLNRKHIIVEIYELRVECCATHHKIFTSCDIVKFKEKFMEFINLLNVIIHINFVENNTIDQHVSIKYSIAIKHL
jgi:hypothetical protein